MANSFNAVKISVSGRNLKERKKENPSWSLGNYEVATTTSSKKFRQLWCCGLFLCETARFLLVMLKHLCDNYPAWGIS